MPVNPPYVCQGRTDHPAQLFRVAMGSVAMNPIVPGTTVMAGGINSYLGNLMGVAGLASMNVSVDTGLCYIPSSTAWNGLYACYNTASVNVGIAASSTTQWRRDYIVAVVTDPGDNTANWALTSVTGTFSSSAPGSLPSLPNNCLPLAIVNVVPNMTVTNGVGTVVNASAYLPLVGVLTASSSARPNVNFPDGTMWLESDSGFFGVILNAGYQYIVTSSIPNANFTWSTLGFSNGWANLAGSFPNLQYKMEQFNAVHLVGVITSASMTNTAFATLPAGFRPAVGQDFPIGFHTSTGPTQGAFLRVATSGVCSIQNATTGTGPVVISAIIPMDLTT